ncbi:MAG TPA: HEAT repeat domain-containing protein [Kofleriaceae bacterium]|nr:HEAT repeat domain-containing protein [Kofleriaceae bacterium]
MGFLPRPSPRLLRAVGLLRALGTNDGRSAIDAFCAGGAAALVGLLDAMAQRVQFSNDAHPADYSADLDDCMVRLARANPDVFVAELEQRPELLQHGAVLAAAGRVPGEQTTGWLLEALADSNGMRRWHALRMLLARCEPRVRPSLRGLLRDRDSSVRFAATDGLRRWGGLADIDELWRYHARATLGGAERALDAIESICGRADAPLPTQHPGARLIDVELPPDAAIAPNVDGFVVRVGAVLATTAAGEIRAPRDGQVVAVDGDASGRPHRLVLRADDPAAG